MPKKSASRSKKRAKKKPSSIPLPPAGDWRINDLRAFAAKKQKVAQFLIAEELHDDAIPHQRAAQSALRQADFIESGDEDDIPF